MGKRDSSKTRVRPFFGALIQRDRTGESWLPRLLISAGNCKGFPNPELLARPGLLRPTNLSRERKLFPPESFLRWLIENPHRMTWPKGGRARFGKETQIWRERLMGIRTEDDRKLATKQALSELSRLGPEGSFQKWWAFEGRTSVDCYLQTDCIRIYIEGKRNDVLSPATDWYPKRNQLLRNLESAASDASGSPFACLLIAEDRTPSPTDAVIQDSLPHMSEQDRNLLLSHYLGCVTWGDACEATAMDYDSLPDTVN